MLHYLAHLSRTKVYKLKSNIFYCPYISNITNKKRFFWTVFFCKNISYPSMLLSYGIFRKKIYNQVKQTLKYKTLFWSSTEWNLIRLALLARKSFRAGFSILLNALLFLVTKFIGINSIIMWTQLWNICFFIKLCWMNSNNHCYLDNFSVIVLEDYLLSCFAYLRKYRGKSYDKMKPIMKYYYFLKF